MSKHTRGPWRVIATPHKSAPGPYAVVSVADGYESTICWIDSVAGEFEDNALLVAAAPDLLQLVIDALEGCSPKEWNPRARAAIAKATQP